MILSLTEWNPMKRLSTIALLVLGLTVGGCGYSETPAEHRREQALSNQIYREGQEEEFREGWQHAKENAQIETEIETGR